MEKRTSKKAPKKRKMTNPEIAAVGRENLLRSHRESKEFDPNKVLKDDVDKAILNELINDSIAMIRKSLRATSVNKKEKRSIALSIVNKYMPSGINIKADLGDDFLNLVKEIHSPGRKTRKKNKR